MKKILFGMAAVSALAAAAPTAAQSGQRGYGGYDIQSHTNVRARIAQLQVRLDAGLRSGAITRAEARPLYRELRQLQQLELRFRRNGISGRENAELQHRIDDLRQALFSAEGRRGWGRDRGDDRWGNRQDDWNDRDSRWEDRDERRRERWEERDERREERWEDREERWEDRDERWDDRRDDRRGGIGGVIDDVLGVGGLRVGQRVTANARLGAVPYEYRSRFRDNSRFYYRSDGRSIYQIDARTNVVLRIYDIRR